MTTLLSLSFRESMDQVVWGIKLVPRLDQLKPRRRDFPHRLVMPRQSLARLVDKAINPK